MYYQQVVQSQSCLISRRDCPSVPAKVKLQTARPSMSCSGGGLNHITVSLGTSTEWTAVELQDCCRRARKDLISKAIAAAASAVLLIGPKVAFADPPMPTPTTEVPAAVNAVNTEENAQLQQEGNIDETQDSGKESTDADKVILKFSRDGNPLGRVVVSVFKDPPLGSQRFLQLARRTAGGYRLSKVDGVSDSFVTVSGVLQLNYVGVPELVGGETVEQLEAEQAVYMRNHDKKGLVSLIVGDTEPKDIREKLVAYQGRFIKVQEVRGASNANGTGFAITLGATPLLDKTNLIIGEVVEGLDVVEQISKLPKVKSSTSSPFFRAAKVLGDRRADVAARSFGKPFGKIVLDAVEVDRKK